MICVKLLEITQESLQMLIVIAHEGVRGNLMLQKCISLICIVIRILNEFIN